MTAAELIEVLKTATLDEIMQIRALLNPYASWPPTPVYPQHPASPPLMPYTGPSWSYCTVSTPAERTITVGNLPITVITTDPDTDATPGPV